MKIAILNPLRFVDQSSIDSSFDGNFFINQDFNYLNPKSYFQPWERSDDLRLQFVSEYIPTALKFRDCRTGAVVSSAAWNLVNTAIVNTDLKVYELEFQMLELSEGHYFAEFNYTDVDAIIHEMVTEPIHVSDIQENTVLIKYKHSINDFNIVFNTGIEFQFRVRSKIVIEDFKSERNVYNDQRRNPTLLSATPYREMKFLLGLTKGVPPWVADKMNFIQSLDQVSYDGVYYQIPEGADYEYTKIEYNSYIAGEVTIQPTDNKFDRYKTEVPDPRTTFTPMQKVTPYLNVSDNFEIANLFNAFSLFEKLCIRKRSVQDLVLNVGITPGGSEIGVFQIDDINFTQTIEWLFSATTTVFLSGLLGADVDVWVIWKQLDEPPIDLSQGSGVVVPPVGKNTVTMYSADAEQLDIDFDSSTGLGRENTNFYGWAWMDGRNGLEDWRGRVPLMQNTDDPDFIELGTIGGSKTQVLTVAQLPKFRPSFQHGYSKRGTTGSAALFDDFNQDTVKEGNEIGGDQAHNNMQPYIVTLFIKKII